MNLEQRARKQASASTLKNSSPFKLDTKPRNYGRRKQNQNINQETTYLSQIISFQKNWYKEIMKRTAISWKSFWALKDIHKSKMPLKLKIETFEK